MGTTTEKLELLQNTKADIKAALIEMGQDAGDVFSTYADKIRSISVGDDTGDATASAGEILAGETAYVNGIKITGSMPNQGSKTASIDAGDSYTIPAGYHNGTGKVTANSLESQTSGTASASEVLAGETAWVDGEEITGTMPNNGAVSQALNAGGSYTIPRGYHDGTGKVTANSLASQTDGTATGGDILYGKTAYVDGEEVTGSIATKTATDLGASGATVTVPAGYYAEDVSKSVTTATQATPSVSIDTTGKITASATQTAGYVSAGTKSGTLQMTTKAAATITPTKSSQTAVAKNVYTTGAITVGAIPDTYQDVTNVTAGAGDVLTGKTFVDAEGNEVDGTMPNQGAKTASLNAGGSYTIPAGYHNGSGKITANSLSSQTAGTASAGEILDGETAWVGGSKITGSMPNVGKQTGSVNAGGSVTITKGYHDGTGSITGAALSGQTSATAGAGDILKDKTAWVNGTKLTGTMTNRGAVSQSLNAGGSYTIPAGYHNGTGKVTANSLSSQTGGTAAAGHILSGKTAWVNGSQITGTIASKSSTDLTASGATVSVPAGYYGSAASKSVATATQATPSISIDSAGKITASATQSAGYVAAGTKSGTKQMTTKGATTITPSTSKQTAVAAGVYTTGAIEVAAMPTATQATPSISVSSAGLITASATQSAGYVAAGTKSGTKQLTTQGAKTVTPGTSAQTAVSSGVYTTGAVTVAGDANLKASNILSGVSIFGVAGSVVAGYRVASGSFTPTNAEYRMFTNTISGLGFKPKMVLIYSLDAVAAQSNSYISLLRDERETTPINRSQVYSLGNGIIADLTSQHISMTSDGFVAGAEGTASYGQSYRFEPLDTYYWYAIG